MNDLKFRLNVHKMKCLECDSIFLVEVQPKWYSYLILSCPVCGGHTDTVHMGDKIIIEDSEHGANVKYRNRIKCLEDKIEELEEFVRDIAENWDCDDHNYNTPCRRCEARKILEDFKNVQ